MLHPGQAGNGVGTIRRLLRLREDTGGFQLPASGDHSLEAVAKLRAGDYYRLPARNFSTIDSLSFIHPHSPSPTLLMFHIACNNDTRDVNTGDLDRINQLLPPYTRAYYVVVTPSGVTLEITIPKSYFPERGSRNSNSTFPFHHPVNESTLFPYLSGWPGTPHLEPCFLL